MKSILTLVFIGMIAVAASANTGPNPGRVFAWDFTNGLSQPWETIGGRWEVRDGCLRQTDPGPDDPKKAIIVTGDAEDWSTDVVVTAKLRIDSWEGDSDSRVGICVCSDRGDGHGLNLVFHRGRLQFLHDFVAWGDGCDFVYETGKWYWMKLSKSGEEICGKAWADSSPEPAEWMITWTDYDDTVTGYPGLNGGSKGSASLSFAQFQVERLTSSERKKSLEGTDVRLDGTWQACPEPLTCIGESGLARVQSASDGWIPAQVPGEIHLDLVKAGKMPDPAVGLNMPQCRWTKTNSWWYRTSFELEAGFQRFERQRLVFDGLDLYAQVFVNGKLAGESADAFVPAVFEVKPFLRPGRNELVVRLTEGSELAPRDLGKSPATFMWPGRIWLRKPQFEWGWDWVDGLPNIGIWRSVRLEGRRYAVLHDLRMDTLRQGNQVSLEMEAVLENLNSAKLRACTLDLEIRPPDGGTTVTRHYAVDAPPGRMPIRDVIEIPDAKLWWPNGMGDQPLYQIVARVLDGSGVATSDRREFSIGLRTIEIDRQRLAQGTRFCFRVNGQDVFCRGGNLGPQDAILARVSDAKYQTLVAEAKNAHMNMFRLNGVSEFEGPAFYEACDRAGILIWHDFMFACSPYPEDNSSFMATVQAEITSAVRMLRHHPSIALWSGNNECYAGCKKLFQQTLPDLCMKLDPKRPYWPGSPCGGNLSGDTHGWYCAFMTPMDIASEFRVRFVSEYGILGPCHLDSIREYLGTEEVTRGTPAWKFHTQDWERANDYVSKGIHREERSRP
ncbi:MAG: hypothetical protein M1608_08155, partial [Candidatus Omnitrophica bacterium]|nr:hypothetical protein [Candidatus Omnitrophota bacterium]